MLYRLIAAAACALFLAGCQQAGPAPDMTAGVTGPSSLAIKKVPVPFSGVLSGEAAFDIANPKNCDLGFTTITTAAGTASHMGRTTWRSLHCVGENHQLLNAELVLTAANGDELHATYTGACAGEVPEVGETFTCSGTAVFSGGTGRFDDASGTADWRATVTFEGFEDFSWPGRWEWAGSIIY